MLEIVAIGPEASQKWRHAMPEGQTVRLGRSPRSGWAVPWDLRISREHVDLDYYDGRLRVRCLETALNPIYRNGACAKEFLLEPGDEFRIGGTVFRLEASADSKVVGLQSKYDAPMAEYSYKQEDVEAFDFRHADHRLEVLWNLPRIISVSRTDEEFAQHLVGLLLDGVPRAEAAAVVQHSDDPTERARPLMMRLDARSDDSVRFRPSRKLILSALERGESLLHFWNEDGSQSNNFTVSGDFDWAFCVPITERSSRGWALYVSGKLSPEANRMEDLNGDIRFTQFIAKVTGAIREVRTLERQQAGLGQYFSPKVMKTLSDARAEKLLSPRECDITVLFCDLRGFSRKAEQARQDLKELLRRCSEALDLMTNGILDHDGVIADFQGDAALGFWGWPVDDGPLPALRAALAIAAGFHHAQHAAGHPLADFNVGIGIAHGRAIAGKIGTQAQAKIGVFGPVVNLAARLESMTKHLRVPILLDEATAEFARANLPASEGRLRKLGRVRPYGLETPLMLTQLLPPVEQDNSISDGRIIEYERAVEAVVEGRWGIALELLDQVPVFDRSKDFLMHFIAQHNYEPYAGWDGVIPMTSK